MLNALPTWLCHKTIKDNTNIQTNQPTTIKIHAKSGKHLQQLANNAKSENTVKIDSKTAKPQSNTPNNCHNIWKIWKRYQTWKYINIYLKHSENMENYEKLENLEKQQKQLKILWKLWNKHENNHKSDKQQKTMKPLIFCSKHTFSIKFDTFSYFL